MPKATLPLVTSLTCSKCGHRMTPAVIIPGMSLFTGRALPVIAAAMSISFRRKVVEAAVRPALAHPARAHLATLLRRGSPGQGPLVQAGFP